MLEIYTDKECKSLSEGFEFAEDTNIIIKKKESGDYYIEEESSDDNRVSNRSSVNSLQNEAI